LVVDKVCDIIFYIIYVALTPAQRVAPKRARPQSILATIPILLAQKSPKGHATDASAYPLFLHLHAMRYSAQINWYVLVVE